MSNQIINVLKNHELRLKALETGKPQVKELNTPPKVVDKQPEQTTDVEAEVLRMKEETLHLKDMIHTMLKDYNRLKDLYITHNIEFLRFKQSITEKNTTDNVALEIQEENETEKKEEEEESDNEEERE